MGRKPLSGSTLESNLIEKPHSLDRTEMNRGSARVLDILAAFNGDELLLGNLDIAQRTGIPKSTVSRITATLAELGYLNYVHEIGKYEIGPRVLALSYSLMSKLQLPTNIHARMEEIAHESNAIVGLSIFDGLNIVYLDSAFGKQPHSRRPVVGYRVPAAFTASGWACISTMNADERAKMLKRLQAEYPEQADEISKNIQKALKDIWQRGYCISFGTFDPLANAVGVPYIHPNKRHIMAFNITAPKTVLTRTAIESTWGPRLVALVRLLQT